MADELYLDRGATGKTLYAVLSNNVGQVYNGSTFETAASANWATYDITMPEDDTTGIYTGNMPSVADGLYSYSVREQSGGSPATTDTVVGGSPQLVWNGSAWSIDSYQAKIWLIDDDTNATDRYVAVWHKNSEPVTSGITSPTIQVIKASDGTDLVGSTAMTEIASTGLYKYDATTGRIAAGALYIAKVQATIDSATRTWYQQIGRDT